MFLMQIERKLNKLYISKEPSSNNQAINVIRHAGQ